MLIFLSRFNCNISEELGAIRWQFIQDTQLGRGKSLTVLPWNAKRPEKVGYHFSVAPEGYYRIAKEAPEEKFFDFVVYDHSTIKMGYSLDLRKPDITGGGKLCDPLPPAPLSEHATPLAVLSPSAQAIAWLQTNPGHTHEEAAFIFGLTRAAVSMAMRRERERLKFAEGD